MNPKAVTQRNLQRERRQRGEDFQAEIRRSWSEIPNCWRVRIPDGAATRPADELILTESANILAEHKRTKSRKFELSFLRPNQVLGLVDFDQVISRNIGLVFVSFHNPEQGLDKAFAIRLITALKYMQKKGRAFITLEELEVHAKTGIYLAVAIPRLNKAEPTYDLRGVVTCCRSI